MKKIVSQPMDPRPSEVHPDLARSSSVRELQPVPQARYGRVNLKKYESFKLNRASIKLSNQECIAMQHLGSWLSSVDVKLNAMNLELVTDIASFCEAFFVYGPDDDRKASIDKCIIESILPYCKNDEEVARTLLKSVSHRIVKSTKFSRRRTKMRNFFFTIVRTCLSPFARN